MASRKTNRFISDSENCTNSILYVRSVDSASGTVRIAYCTYGLWTEQVELYVRSVDSANGTVRIAYCTYSLWTVQVELYEKHTVRTVCGQCKWNCTNSILYVRSVDSASGTVRLAYCTYGLWTVQVEHTVTKVLQNHHIKTRENCEVRYEVTGHVIFTSIARFISCESKHFR
jgi:hypothetical protein